MASERTAQQLLDLGEEAWVEAGFRTGDFTEARALLRAARDQACEERSLLLEATALDLLGLTHHYENITVLMAGGTLSDEAVATEEQLFREALDIQELEGHASGAARSLFGLGLVAQVLRRDWAEAMPLYWQALEIVDRLGDAVDLYTRSEVHRHVGFYFLVEESHPQRAVAHLERSLDLREELRDLRRVPSGFTALGQAELAAGNPRRAVELLERAVELGKQAGLLPSRIQSDELALAEARAVLARQTD